jgi:hypothetical protein
MTRAWLLLFFLAAAAAASAAEPGLKIVTPERTLAFSAEEIAALPRKEIAALEPHGKQEHRYAGVAVRDVLARAGVTLGEKLRGAALQLVVRVCSRDGYVVVFALAEFDEAFSRRTLLLADRMDAKPLADTAGPLQLVVPGDTRAARWARMVTSLEVVAVGASGTGAKP